MMNLPENHPAWKFVTIIGTILSLGFVLWLNASHFDETELRTIFEFGLLLAAGKGIKSQVVKNES